MHTDSELERAIITRLRQAVAEAEQRGYERGVRETMEKIQNLVMPGPLVATPSANAALLSRGTDAELVEIADDATTTRKRKRAPKGLVRKVVKRALEATPGLTPAEIESTARGGLEKMIRASSYRSELRKGREAGLYREDGGKWFLVENGKAEDSRSSMTSVFDITPERG